MLTRIKIIFFLFLGLYGLLFLRSFYLQVLPNERLAKWTEKQFQSSLKINPRRPSIVDSNQKELAFSVESYSLFADPHMITQPKKVSRKLAKILKMNQANLYSKIKQNEKRFVWVKRFLTRSERDKILDLKISGLGFIQEFKRVYPNENLLGHSLGAVGVEGQGLSGVELWIDRHLPQATDFVTVPRDAKGRPLLISEAFVQKLLRDQEVQLTIDRESQHYIEKKIRQTRQQQEAKAVFSIVLDLENHEIRALAYDSNEVDNSKFYKNPLINNVYEFGSVLKPLSIGAALDEKIISLNYVAHLEGGTLQIGNRRIKESSYDPKTPEMNLTKIMSRSSNIGTAKIAFKLGDEKLFQAYQKFGFMQKTGVNLPGESKGLLSPPPWSKHLLSNISFGQGVAITPLQLVMAYAAIATDGQLRTPVLVKKINDTLSGAEDVFQTQILHPVFAPETLVTLKKLMAAVVETGGTGEKAKILGYSLAGKTGTAQKALENGRGYKPKAYLSSFVGFFPLEKPKFVVLVAVDEPQKDYYGSQVAAPLFSDIGTYLTRRFGVPPSDPEAWDQLLSLKSKNQQSLPESMDLAQFIQTLRGKNINEALKLIQPLGLSVRVRGQGESISEVVSSLEEDSEKESLTLILE